MSSELRALNKRQKLRGLQKLRWYCQMCEKQCRDEPGFQSHLLSERHIRQMALFRENADDLIEKYSKQFEDSYLELLRKKGDLQVNANQLYQDIVADRQHIHMTSTKWDTLTSFIQYLGATGKAEIEYVEERGWMIKYINRDADFLKRKQIADKYRANSTLSIATDEETNKGLAEQLEQLRRLEAEAGVIDNQAANSHILDPKNRTQKIAFKIVGPGGGVGSSASSIPPPTTTATNTTISSNVTSHDETKSTEHGLGHGAIADTPQPPPSTATISTTTTVTGASLPTPTTSTTVTRSGPPGIRAPPGMKVPSSATPTLPSTGSAPGTSSPPLPPPPSASLSSSSSLPPASTTASASSLTSTSASTTQLPISSTPSSLPPTITVVAAPSSKSIVPSIPVLRKPATLTNVFAKSAQITNPTPPLPILSSSSTSSSSSSSSILGVKRILSEVTGSVSVQDKARPRLDSSAPTSSSSFTATPTTVPAVTTTSSTTHPPVSVPVPSGLWVRPGLVVKVLNKTVGDGLFYKRKGTVTRTLTLSGTDTATPYPHQSPIQEMNGSSSSSGNVGGEKSRYSPHDWVGTRAVEVWMNDGKRERIRIDYRDVETVIPAIGRKVAIVGGKWATLPGNSSYDSSGSSSSINNGTAASVEEEARRRGMRIGTLIAADMEGGTATIELSNNMDDGKTVTATGSNMQNKVVLSFDDICKIDFEQ